MNQRVHLVLSRLAKVLVSLSQFNWKFAIVFSFTFSLGYLADAASCPKGWTYFPKQKACQYFSKNVLALNCSSIANQSWTAAQTCVQVGNCRQSFVSRCQRMQADCRKDKQNPCPGQFVVEGVSIAVADSTKAPAKTAKTTTGGSGGASKAGTGGSGTGGTGTGGTGTGAGGSIYSGGLGTGEGY